MPPTAPPVSRLLVGLLLVGLLGGGTATAAVQPGGGADRPDELVQRFAGANRADTAALAALDGWTTSDRAVLVDGAVWTDALIGAHLAARLDVPVLVSGPSVPVETLTVVERLGIEDVVAVGDVAVPEATTVQRLVAADPAALAAAALDLVPPGPDQPVVLASAAGFADALAAANLAPAGLLLTAPDGLASAADAAIRRHDPATVVLVGGTAALSEQVADDVRTLDVEVHRVAGPTRVDTALAAQRSATDELVLASAGGFADAVAMVPWTARRAAGLLLTPHDELPGGVDAALRDGPATSVVVAGGTAVVGNFVDRQAAAAVADQPPPGFVGAVRPLTDAERTAMTGVSWHEGCPVPLEDLVAIDLAHWGADGNVVDDGQLVVHRDVGPDVLGVMALAFDVRFPLTRVRPVREYGGDDDASMAADNTSAFNCRTVSGTSTWSTHSWGTAIDINPVRNPWVRGEQVEPPAGEAWLDRTDVRPGMLVEGGPIVSAFDALGWGWGGRWTNSRDYQHVSTTGR